MSAALATEPGGLLTYADRPQATQQNMHVRPIPPESSSPWELGVVNGPSRPCNDAFLAGHCCMRSGEGCLPSESFLPAQAGVVRQRKLDAAVGPDSMAEQIEAGGGQLIGW